jgi:O-antigen/teichoic acid export membrane protein
MLKFFKSLWGDSWSKLIESFWLFFRYSLSQFGIQGINMVTGFLIIRALTKDDYANYTIINTLVPVMLMLSDNGIGTGIFSIGRHIWQDDEKMGRLVNTGLQLRRKFALVSFLLLGPILAWMLFHNHAPISTIVLLTVVTLTGISFQPTEAVMRAVLELRQHIKTIAKVGLIAALLRLCLVAGFAVFLHLNAFLATLAGTCAIILETSFFVRAVKPQIHWDASPDSEYRATIFSIVKKVAPLTIYFCVQGQISIWLISIFGSSHQVADIGATVRLGVIFTTLASSYSTIMVPRFARNNGRRRLFVQFLQIVISLMLMLLVLSAFAKLFPAPFIMLLGSKYSNMSGLIWLVIFSSGLHSLAGVIFGLNMSKGWIPPAILTIPVEIITQIVLLLSLNLSKTESVLIFSCLSTIPPTIINTVLLLRRISHEAE